MLFQALGADDSWSRPVSVKTSPTPQWEWKELECCCWFFPPSTPAVRNTHASEGLLVLGQMDWEEKIGAPAPALPWLLCRMAGWVFNITQWKLPLRAATVGFSSFWDSWAVISTGRFVNLLVLLCACRPNCQSLAASFTVMLWATVVHCVIQTEAHFSALCLIKVLSEAFAVVGAVN